MSILYTINGLYPDRNFAFTLRAAGLGIAPKEHLHGIGDVRELSGTLAGKSDIGHTHVALPAINAGESRLTGSVTLAAGSGASVLRTYNKISIGVTPVQAGAVGGFRNANPARRHSRLLFFAGDKRSATGAAEYFIFTEDGNAASS
ncbi:MAG: Phage tail repeat like protein [Lentisphaerae bacterium ADurb.Bin242]|nr:MAG: Phage tail repeat like protein [Lentisphaerae bacterium ADurb.Bin242]